MECGACKYNRYDPVEQAYYCDNQESDNYGVFTAYDDNCEDFEEKE